MPHFPVAVFTRISPSKEDLHRLLVPFKVANSNPRSKWKHYVVGEHWGGQLIVKDVVTGDLLPADSARIEALDLPAMLERNREKLGRAWDNAHSFQKRFGRPGFMMPDTGCISRDDYVAGATAFTPFAYILDGQWHEKGEMNPLGIVRNEKPDNVWVSEFSDVLTGQPPDHWITVFDCHI